MPKVYAIDGITPVVDPSAFVHPSAVLIGDVIVGPGAYIGPCACLRGDFGRIVVEAGANVQDTCVLHGFQGKDTVVGEAAWSACRDRARGSLWPCTGRRRRDGRPRSAGSSPGSDAARSSR